ncbi:MAG: DUF4382 domain-containing protein [Gemmatimonadota bacterium]|nr:DUF4382 domain-containing protein [Gemmatimonadota bacterium]
MNRRPSWPIVAGLVFMLALGVAACGTGPETGSVQVVMTRTASTAASVSPAFSLDSGTGDVALEDVESIRLTLVRVDLKPSASPEDDSEADDESDADESGEWIRLDVPVGTTIDLLALPSVGGQGVAEGEVTATTFKEVRLVCGGPAMMRLRTPVVVNGGQIIGDDESLEQPLRIPSCESSGLKIKGATFRVPADGEAVATIELSTDAAIRSIEWNAQGFRMNPVMRLKRN